MRASVHAVTGEGMPCGTLQAKAHGPGPAARLASHPPINPTPHLHNRLRLWQLAHVLLHEQQRVQVARAPVQQLVLAWGAQAWEASKAGCPAPTRACARERQRDRGAAHPARARTCRQVAHHL